MRQITLNEMNQVSAGFLYPGQKANLIKDAFCAVGDAVLIGSMISVYSGTGRDYKTLKIMAPAVKMIMSYFSYQAANYINDAHKD